MANTYTDARKLYYEKNKEKINAKARAKRALNNPKVELTEDEIKQKKEKRKQQRRASSLKYYRKNKDLINKKAREKYVAKPKVKADPKTKEEIALANKIRRKKYELENKEKIKERLKKYYQDNKEKIKNYNNEWQKNNAEYVKRYKEENREAYNAKKRETRDPVKEAERSKKWRLGEGREVYLNGKKRWRKNNKDKVNEAQRRGYLKKLFKGLDAPKELVEAKQLQLMIEREIKNEKRI